MAISRITTQDALGAATTASVAATYAATPKRNNLLIATVFSNVTTGSNLITGWTAYSDQLVGNSTSSVTLFYKIALGTESTTVTATATSATVMKIHIYEYTGNLAIGTVTDGTTNGNSGASTVSTQTTGALATTSPYTGDLLFVTLGTSAAVTLPAWDSGFTLRQQDTNVRLFDGDQIVGDNASYSSSASWTTAAKATAIIAAFKAAPLPTALNNYQFVKVGDGMSVGEKIR